MKNAKNWGSPRSTVEFKDETEKKRRGTVLGRRCPQCRKQSLVSWTHERYGPMEECLNNCGPEELFQRFRF